VKCSREIIPHVEKTQKRYVFVSEIKEKKSVALELVGRSWGT